MKGLKVKVCGITRPEDAELAMELGADYIGMIVYPQSKRYVSPEKMKPLLDIIPVEKRVIVDVVTATDDLERYLEWQASAYQIHFPLETPLSFIAAWNGICGIERFWPAPKIPPQTPFPQVILEFADTILLDAYVKDGFGGTGIARANWQSYLDYSMLYQHKQWFLAGGLGPNNLEEALEFTEAQGVDLNSGLESSPGIKDADKMKRAFDIVSEKRA